MAFLLTSPRPPDARPEPARFTKGAAPDCSGTGVLHLECDTGAEIAGWASETRDGSNTQPGLVVYGRPLAPAGDASDTSAGDPCDRPLSALQLVRFVAANGFDAVEQLRGSFVVVAAHEASDRVDCYRSRAGGRTCYWTDGPDGWAISDSAAAVARTRVGAIGEEPRWLARFFTLSNHFSPGSTAFEGVRELMPGEHLSIAGGRVATRRTPLALGQDDRPRSMSEWVEAFGARLERAVDNCLPSNCLPIDQPAAIMLSGGMDSGPAAVLANHLATHRDIPLHAVSWRIKGFPDCDEWEWISMLARHLDIDLTEIDAERHLPFSSLAADQVDIDSPVYNAFRPLILACYENARRLGCEVILNASTGDALYPHPARALLDDIVHADVRSATRRLAAILRHHGPLGLHRAAELRAVARAVVPRRRPAKLATPGWLTETAALQLEPVTPWPAEFERSLHPDFGRQLFGAAASGGAARELRFSQRFGIDRRDPYLDPDLRGLMFRMPHALIHRRGLGKWVAREAMKGRMPEAFRLKPRTGLLNAFFNHGFDRQRDEIRTFLMDQTDLWAAWVRPDYLEATLSGKSSAEHPRLVAGACIGYVLWKKRLRARTPVP